MSRSHCFLSGIMAGIIRVRTKGVHVCDNGCSTCTLGGTRLHSTRCGTCLGRRQSVGRRRTIVTGLGSFGHRGSVGHTRDHRGVLSGIRHVSGPRRVRGRVHVSLRPEFIDKGSILAIRDLSGSFPKRALFDSVSFRVGHKRHMTLVNGGNANGAAVLGVVGKLVSTSDNEFALNSGMRVNCCSRRRRILRVRGAVFRRVSSTCPALARARVQGVLTTFLFAKSSMFGLVSTLSNKRENHISLTGLVLSRTGFLVLSRPAGRLSVTSGRVLRRTLGDCAKAMFCISRSHCFVGRATAQVLSLAGRTVMGCVKSCSCCLRGGRRLARGCTPTTTRTIARTGRTSSGGLS